MTLQDLIAELEAADEGSKDLDATIHSVLNGSWYPYALTVAEPVTTSVDAAVGLCERLLPGWVWEVSSAVGATVSHYEYREVDVAASTPALSLTIATLKAHLEQSDE